METRISLRIDFEDKILAKAVEEALKPDNSDLPNDMEISMTRRGRSITIQVKVLDNLPSLAGTIQEIIQHCEVSLRSITQTL